jgi:Fe2+ or Zn2+ uptake regulation protein
MITDIEKKLMKRRSLSWYKEQLQSCIERERLNHSYKRVTVLEMLYETQNPVSVEQLYFSLSRESGSRISINTVYCIIKLLVAFDFVVRIESNGSPKYTLNTYEECTVSVFCRGSGESLLLNVPSHWQFQLIQMLRKQGADLSGAIELRIECCDENGKKQ